MARIKHIALSTDDPVKTAEFYKSQFGLKELRREPAATGADGVWLSDGTSTSPSSSMAARTPRTSAKARRP